MSNRLGSYSGVTPMDFNRESHAALHFASLYMKVTASSFGLHNLSYIYGILYGVELVLNEEYTILALHNFLESQDQSKRAQFYLLILGYLTM